MKHIFVFMLLLLLCGCSEWLTVMPKTQMPADDMFKTKDGFRDALIGCYMNLANTYRVEGELVSGFTEHIACQWEGYTEESAEGKLNLHEYFDADDKILRMFENLYKGIADINIIMENIDNGILKEEDKNPLKGELLALRAFIHFDLIRLWGPIPTSSGSKKYLPYVTKVQVDPYDYYSYSQYMDFLQQDLDEAERLLVPEKSETGQISIRPFFLQYYGLIALRSRIALWLDNKEDACKYANMIRESGLFRLGNVTDINAGNYSFPCEHIFTLSQATTQTEVLTSYYIFEESLNSFLFNNDASDIRLSLWKKQENLNEEEEYVKMNCIKYNLPEQEQMEGDKIEKQELITPIIRLAELYLILIECSDLQTANELYEEFCQARRCSYIPIDEQNKFSILMKEYQKEFVGEGQLFYFYKRMGLKYMPRCVRPCGTASYVLPLPRKEIDITY